MIHNDHLGTPQKMTDASGAVVWAADYKPFGETTITVSTITNNLRFPGQYYDAETGLNYNYYRDYDPVIGRYKQADRIGLRGGINSFAYVENNPLKWKDPRGLLKIKRGYEIDFEILNRYNPYIIAMITWIENRLPRECEIEITEAWRSYDQYIDLYPHRNWDGYMQNKHALLVAVDMKADKREGEPCDKKCDATVAQLADLAGQAGFNGIGIYDKHIHVDFRDKYTTWKGVSR